MHLLRLAASALLASSLLTAAGTAGGKAKPIPQDVKAQEQRSRDMLAWNQQTLLGAYKKVGKKDARWDPAAQQALDTAARFFSHQAEPDAMEKLFASAKQALDAGCDDPLILYLHARSSYGSNHPGAAEIVRRFVAAAKALESSAYPPFRRAVALNRAAFALLETGKDDETREQASRLLDAALALLPKSAEQDERSQDVGNTWFEIAREVLLGRRQLGDDYAKAFAHVDKVLSSNPSLKVVRVKVKADYLVPYAWEARGGGFASTVTEEGWKKFRERLGESRQAIEEVWKIEPAGDAFAATLMITVNKGLGGDRDDMEKWFDRAMKLDCNNRKACEAKLDWLDPKWHGSDQEMLAFGRACRDTHNWRSGIPLLLAETHRCIRRKLPKDKRDDYFKADDVWKDIAQVYDEHLKVYPQDAAERSKYAGLCYMAGRIIESDQQFRVLGDNIVGSRLYPEAWLKQVKSHVGRIAASKKKQEDK